MDQPSATTSVAAPAQPQEDSPPLEQAVAPSSPGFGSRGRLRRRARFLRKARELAYRDLGGLVFSLHRFGQRNDELVLAKLATLSRIDAELRALESSLGERQPVTVLREAGITACPRCAAIHSGEDRFCPSCGLPLSRNVDLPIGAAPAAAPEAVMTPAPAPAAPASVPASPVGPGVPAAPPTPAQPAAAPLSPAGAAPSSSEAPATQAHAAVVPGLGGRSPAPPTPASPASESAGETDQPTEIIRPSAPGA